MNSYNYIAKNAENLVILNEYNANCHFFTALRERQTHALFERLAEYVMNKIPEIEQRLDKIEQEKADKRDIQLILDGMDAQAKQLDMIHTKQAATNAALLRHEKRITALEEKVK